MKSETTAVKLKCSKCCLDIENFSADPGLWPIWLYSIGCNGEGQPFHQRCVTSPNDVDTLRTRLAEVEARLQEAVRLLRDVPWLHQTIPLHNYLDWIKARDAFLNPTNKDVQQCDKYE